MQELGFGQTLSGPPRHGDRLRPDRPEACGFLALQGAEIEDEVSPALQDGIGVGGGVGDLEKVSDPQIFGLQSRGKPPVDDLGQIGLTSQDGEGLFGQQIDRYAAPKDANPVHGHRVASGIPGECQGP